MGFFPSAERVCPIGDVGETRQLRPERAPSEDAGMEMSASV